MPTSDVGPKGSARRLLLAVLTTLLLVVVADVALSLALEPYAGSTELMWSEYRKADDIDTVLVGPSTTGYGISPQTLDAALGSHSFNMATPGQALRDSLVSIQCAKRDHDVSRAITCIGYETILEFPYINSSVVYTQAKCAGEPVHEALADVFDLVTYDYYFGRIYSLSAAFPWTYDHVELTGEAVARNVWRRLNLDTLEAAGDYARTSNDEGWSYWGQGYDGYEVDYPASHEHGTIFSSHRDAPIIDATTRALTELCQWCSDNGVDLYVIGAPYVPSVILEYGDAYWQGMAAIQDIAESHGAHYVDLNMCTREVFDPSLSHFFNQVHLNHRGAEAAGTAIGSLVARIEAGDDISPLWHPHTEQGFAAWLEELDYVDSLDYATATEGDTTIVEAYARTGPSTPVAYRFELQDADGSWREIRAWDADPRILLDAAEVAGRRIRISAHATTGGQDQDRMVEGPLA